LVNKRWKQNIDERLEAFTLSSFSLWRPYADSEPAVVPKLFVNTKRKTFLAQERTTFPISKLPFATKSLALVKATKDQNSAEDIKRVSFLKIFEAGGLHLTSLSLDGLKLQWSTLVQVLSQTSSLKALHMNLLEIYDSTFKTTLPPLSQLQTMLLTCVQAFNQFRKKVEMESGTVQSLLFEPYLNQLTTLKIREYHGPEPPLRGSQANLKQLVVHYLDSDFLMQSDPAPILQRLSISCEVCLIDFNLLELMDYISKYAESLVHLHLNVEWYNLTVGDDKNRCNELDLRTSGKEKKLRRERDPFRIQLANMCIGIPNAFQTFFNLKTLAVCYPDKKEDIEAELLKQVFIVKAPMLENLLLLQFGRIRRGYYWREAEAERSARAQSKCAKDVVIVRKFLKSQNYWRLCSQLRNITVVYEADYNAPHHIVFQEIR